MAKPTKASDAYAVALGDEGLSSQVQGLLEAGGGCADLDRDPNEHMGALLSYSGRGANRDVAFLKMAAFHQSPCLTLAASVCSLRSWFIESYGDRLIDVLMRLAEAARAEDHHEVGGGGPEGRQWDPDRWDPEEADGFTGKPIDGTKKGTWVWAEEDPDLPGMLAEHSLKVIDRVSTGQPVEDGEDVSLEELADANLPPEIAATNLPEDVGAADVVRLLTQQDAEARIKKAAAKELALSVALANVYVDGPAASWLAALEASSEKDRWGLVAFCVTAELPLASALLKAGLDASELLDAMRFDLPVSTEE